MSQRLAVASLLFAWVLWEQTTALLGEESEFWRIVSTHDARQPCMADHARIVTNYRAESRKQEVGVRQRVGDDNVTTTYSDDDGKLINAVTKRALCVPATLDPRPREK